MSSFRKILLVSSLVLLANCTSERSRVEESVQGWVQNQARSEAQKEAQNVPSDWLRQAYQDFLGKNTEVKIIQLDVKDSGEAMVDLQVQKIHPAIRSSLLGIIAKIPSDKVHNFNLSDGAILVQKQLGLSEKTTWGPAEKVRLQKGPNGWNVQD